MKNQNRLTLLKEIFYYLLGILLISGFVYIYWSQFRDVAGPPWAQRYILYNWGKTAAIAINAVGFLLFIVFLPFRDQIEWRLKGMLLVFWGWMKIHKAKGLVTDGIYRYIRPPQYTGIFLIITGWMFRWLNPLMLVMYPILLILYYNLARKEEKHVLKRYADAYLKYKAETPMFFPIKVPTARRKTAKNKI